MESKSTTTGNRFKWLLFFQLLVVTAVVTSCGNSAKEKRQKELDEFKTYVQSQKDSVDFYADHNRDELDKEYERRKAELDKQADKMDEQSREAYNNTVNDWNSLKQEYSRKAEENATVAKMDKIRNELVLDGVRPDYTDLNAKDLVKAYQHFVNAVETNKDEYTSEEWTVVNVNFKALNGRKREIEKDIPEGDRKKIMQLQLQYTGIKVVNRPIPQTPEVL